MGDQPVGVVHPVVRRPRRQRTDDHAAVETDARTAPDVDRNVGRCDEPRGGRIDLGISSQAPAIEPGCLQPAHCHEGVSRRLAQARRNRPLCIQAGDGYRDHRGRNPGGAVHLVLKVPVSRFSVIRLRRKNRSYGRCSCTATSTKDLSREWPDHGGDRRGRAVARALHPVAESGRVVGKILQQ